MKHRLERIRELIKRELGAIIQRELVFSSPLVSINAVDITPDLKQAHVFISVVGEEKEQQKALEVLDQNRAMLQHALSRRVILKYTPRLHFRLDESIERGSRIIELMDELGLTHESGETDILQDDEEHPL